MRIRQRHELRNRLRGLSLSGDPKPSFSHADAFAELLVAAIEGKTVLELLQEKPDLLLEGGTAMQEELFRGKRSIRFFIEQAQILARNV